MVSAGALIHAVIYLIVLGLIWWLLQWLLDYVKPPEPFYKLAKVVLAVAAVLVCIAVLLSLAGHPLVVWP